MPEKSCVFCGEEIDSRAKICPHCRKSQETKVCRYCRSTIEKRAAVCPHCQKKQGTSAGAVIVALGVVVIGLPLFTRACSGFMDGYMGASESAAFSESVSKESESDYKSSCKAITYDEIARDKDALDGHRVTFTGEIIQVMDDMYRINITKEKYGYTDTVIFEFDARKLDENILEGDIVTIWGESKGFYSYESVLGQKVTVPRVKAAYIQNDGKSE